MTDEELRDTIVFVLTTSNDDKDKFEAYNLNVAGYMLKSDMGNSFVRAVSLVDNYWRVVEFPEISKRPPPVVGSVRAPGPAVAKQQRCPVVNAAAAPAQNGVHAPPRRRRPARVHKLLGRRHISSGTH